VKARTPLHCLDKDRKDIPNFQIFFRLSSAGRDLRAVRRLRACEGRRRSRRPARRSSTDGRPPPHRGESTAAPGRDGERVVPHRRATDEGKRPSARGGGTIKTTSTPESAVRCRGTRVGKEGPNPETEDGGSARSPGPGRPGCEGTKGRRGEEAKGQRVKGAKSRKKSRCRPASPPGRRQYFFLQFVNLCVTLRDKAP